MFVVSKVTGKQDKFQLEKYEYFWDRALEYSLYTPFM